MTPYTLAISDSLNYSDRSAFVSDLVLSSIWGEPEDADIPDACLEWRSQLWDASRRFVREMLMQESLGLVSLQSPEDAF
jgi:hypothetical protein